MRFVNTFDEIVYHLVELAVPDALKVLSVFATFELQQRHAPRLAVPVESQHGVGHRVPGV